MTFNSLTFIAFFAIVALLHRLPLSWRTKKLNLLVASLRLLRGVEPAVRPAAVGLDVHRLEGRALDRPHRGPGAGASWSCCCRWSFNLGLLGYFKYGGFLLENFQSLAATVGIDYTPPEWNIILPIGISFYTFQTMSYTLDVYLRRARPAKSFLDFALFVTFFPHLVAGPIVRPTDLLPQFERRVTADAASSCAGA